MATLFKRARSPFWWVTWTVGGKRLRDSTGVRHDGKRTPPETAKQVLRSIEDRLVRQRYGLEMPMTQAGIAEFFGGYGRTLGGRDGTVANRQNALDRFVEWCAGAGVNNVADITRATACDYVTQRTAKGIMMSTMKAQLTVLGMAMDEAKTRNHVRFEANPFHMKIKTDSAEKEPFSQAQVSAMLAMKAPKWMHLAMRLCLSTGARIGTVLQLQWEDIDVVTGVIHFRKSKKGAYTVPISDELVAHLAPVKQDIGMVFSAIAGQCGSYAPNAFTRTVQRECGFQANWHRFRHTWVTAMQANGVPMRIAMTLADHTSESVHEGYSHSTASGLRSYIKDISLFTKAG